MSASFFQSPKLAPLRRMIAFTGCACLIVVVPMWAGQIKNVENTERDNKIEHVTRATFQPFAKPKPQVRRDIELKNIELKERSHIIKNAVMMASR